MKQALWARLFLFAIFFGSAVTCDKPGDANKSGTPSTPDPPNELGEPVQEVFGIQMPQGSYQVAEDDEVGHEGAPSSTRYLVTAQRVEDIDQLFSKASTNSDLNHHRHSFAGGVSVAVKPIADIPRRRPALAEAPANMNSWVVVHRQGEPTPCPPCPEGFSGTLMPGCTCK